MRLLTFELLLNFAAFLIASCFCATVFGAYLRWQCEPRRRWVSLRAGAVIAVPGILLIDPISFCLACLLCGRLLDLWLMCRRSVAPGNLLGVPNVGCYPWQRRRQRRAERKADR